MFTTWIELCICLFGWTEGPEPRPRISVQEPAPTLSIEERYVGSWKTAPGSRCAISLNVKEVGFNKMEYHLQGKNLNASGIGREHRGALVLYPGSRPFYFQEETGTLRFPNPGRDISQEANIPECPVGPLEFVRSK